jgi:hypothetical protein
MATMASEHAHTPQRLGDVRLLNTRGGWELWHKGHKACAGLTTRQVCQIIQGTLDIGALLEAANGRQAKA